MTLINRNWPYAWAIAIATWSFVMTYQSVASKIENVYGGTLDMVYIPFLDVILLTCGYSAILFVSLPRIIQPCQLGHLIAFIVAAFIGFKGANLQCVGAMMYMIVIFGVVFMWTVAAALFAMARIIVPAKEEPMKM